jgi:hypothetical protein
MHRLIVQRKRLSRIVCVVVAAAALFASGASSATSPFTDPVGDAGVAPDITNVVVSDDSHGVATVSVTTAGFTPGDDVIVTLDADKNASTGDDGVDYYYEAYYNVDGSRGWDAERWTGSEWKTTPDSKTETYSRSGNVFTWTFSQTDIGGSTGFTFFVFSTHEDTGGNVLGHDYAPDGGGWSFVFTKSQGDVEPPTVTASPAHGKAKKPTRLHYHVGDNSGKVGVVIALYKGSHLLGTLTIKGGVQAIDFGGDWWTAYTFAARGSYRFCVIARDAAGNKSRPACAPVVVS